MTEIIIYDIIYPCISCVAAVLDMNSPESFMCHVDGHHACILESLSDECPLERKPRIIERRRD